MTCPEGSQRLEALVGIADNYIPETTLGAYVYVWYMSLGFSNGKMNRNT